MNNIYYPFFILLLLASSCNAQNKDQENTNINEQVEPTEYNLDDYLKSSLYLENRVNKIFSQLNDTSIVAQLLMPAIGKYGQSKKTIDSCISSGIIGGLLMLNGTKETFTTWIKEFENINSSNGNLPFLYSADAEPSLVNRKIIGSQTVKKANQILSKKEVIETASIISNDLLSIGINYNFAPVVDFSKNKTVGYRGFGSKREHLIPWSIEFINETQNKNIIATAKHFPGHGLVSGDTHQSLQVIDGDLKELSTYPPLIKNGVLSVMVAHIAVKNNSKYDTKGFPATTSKIIVNDLLRDSLGFKGLIVTDAMNMGGVTQVKNSEIKSIEAGCDIILMPVNVFNAHKNILEKYKSDDLFRKSVNESAKRIIRMKICLGIISPK
ncbi:MAG: hypothetical protein CL824_05310 [Crocinitomicaceae bacterium]|nr:hypothetical protein [Crocinitomicaceae bacterium]